MDKFIFNSLSLIFGTSLQKEISDFIQTIMTALETIFKTQRINSMLDLFIGVSVSFMLIYFFIDLASKASADLLTFEKLVLSMIKIVTVMAILLMLTDLIYYLFQIIKGIYDKADAFQFNFGLSGTKKLKFEFAGHVYNKWPTKYKGAVKTDFQNAYGSKIKTIFLHMDVLLGCLLPFFVLWIARMAAYFIALSNAIVLIIRTIFMPIAVVQCFDEGQRSAGIQYLKKFLAIGVSFAVIILSVSASEILNTYMLSSTLTTRRITIDTLSTFIGSPKGALVACSIQLAAVGAMLMGSKIANDVIGTHI